LIIEVSITCFYQIKLTSQSIGYGDSSKNELSEDAVVNDCVQLYEWLVTKTSAPIFIWGHSLGTALASRTTVILHSKPNISQPVGLILEAAFTKMSEELYVHPYGKVRFYKLYVFIFLNWYLQIFAWLPWFDATIVKPLEKNGFLFDNSKHILNVECPILILSAEDDSIVPYRFGQKVLFTKSINIDTFQTFCS
jgi:abhydrolase domain-containing protein 12